MRLQPAPLRARCRRPGLARVLAVLGALAAILLPAPPSVQSETFFVPDGDVSSAGDEPTRTGGLAWAVARANDESNFPGPDRIVLAEEGHYAFAQAENGAGTIHPNALPRVASAIAVEGRGAVLAREAPAETTFRFFHVEPAGALELARLELRGGRVEIHSPPEARGGAIYSEGALALADCLLTSNTLFGSQVNYGIAEGGAIFSAGSLEMRGCAAVANAAIAKKLINNTGGSSARARGGFLFAAGSAQLVNCTISGNLADCSLYGDVVSQGGGIFAEGAVSLDSCTVAGNAVTGSIFGPEWGTLALNGGGLAAVAGGASLHSTILAGNTVGGAPNDLGGTGNFVSSGYNLVQFVGAEAAISGNLAGNLIGADPMLLPLAENGGLTLTHALPALSPAVDAGDPLIFPPADQRGFHRPMRG